MLLVHLPLRRQCIHRLDRVQCMMPREFGHGNTSISNSMLFQIDSALTSLDSGAQRVSREKGVGGAEGKWVEAKASSRVRGFGRLDLGVVIETTWRFYELGVVVLIAVFAFLLGLLCFGRVGTCRCGYVREWKWVGDDVGVDDVGYDGLGLGIERMQRQRCSEGFVGV
jgi:hypothetical protein